MRRGRASVYIPVTTSPVTNVNDEGLAPMMNIVKAALGLSSLVVCLASAAASGAEKDGPSATGSFRFPVAGLVHPPAGWNSSTTLPDGSSNRIC